MNDVERIKKKKKEKEKSFHLKMTQFHIQTYPLCMYICSLSDKIGLHFSDVYGKGIIIMQCRQNMYTQSGWVRV